MTDTSDDSDPNLSPFANWVHQDLPKPGWKGLSQDEARALREQLVASIVQIVVQAITGVFTPGGGLSGAIGQITAWATGLIDRFTAVGERFQRVADLFNIVDTDLDGTIDRNDVWTSIINTIIHPLGLLTNSTDFGDLLDKLWDAVNGSSGSSGKSISDVFTKFTGFFGSSGTFQSLLNNIFDGSNNTTGSTGKTLTNVLTALQGHRADTGTVVDNIINKLGGILDTGNAAAATAQPLADTAANIAAANAAIAALQTSNGEATTGGVRVVVDFSTYANSTNLPSIFTEIYSANIVSGGAQGTGTYGVTSGRAHVVQDGSNPRFAHGIYNVTPTDGDNQMIGAVWTSTPGLNILTGRRCYNYIEGRSNSAGTSRIFAKFAADSVELGCYVSGIKTSFAILGTGGSGSFSFKSNAAYFLQIGTSGNARTYIVWENTTAILNYTEGGTTSQLGASYRYCSHGAAWEDFGGVLITSADLLYFSLADTIPATYLGSVARFYRANTANVSHNGATKLANSFLDTIDYQTSDITWTPASNNTVTVSKEGVYIVTLSILNANVANNNTQALTLYKGASVVRGGIGLGTSSTQPQNGARLQTTWQIYLKAGDTISPGIDFSTSANITGEASGTRTYFEIAKVA